MVPAVGLVKPVENPRPTLRRYAASMVTNRYAHRLGILLRDIQIDRTLFWAVLHRVVEQIPEDLLEANRVHQRYHRVWRLDHHRMTGPRRRDHIPHQRGQVDREAL